MMVFFYTLKIDKLNKATAALQFQPSRECHNPFLKACAS